MIVHKHTFTRAWTRGYEHIGERCSCGEQRERTATKVEQKEIRAEARRRDKQTALMHRRWHDLNQQVLQKKLTGYDLMEELEKYGRKHKDVHLVRVDDDMHAGSTLAFIEHKCTDARYGKEYWGTTALYVPQNGTPAEFFLYPGHLRGLVETLQAIEKTQRKYPSVYERLLRKHVKKKKKKGGRHA